MCVCSMCTEFVWYNKTKLIKLQGISSLKTVYICLDLRHFLAIHLSPGAALHSESNHEFHTKGPTTVSRENKYKIISVKAKCILVLKSFFDVLVPPCVTNQNKV